MPTISGKQQLQLLVVKVSVQCLTYCEMAVTIEPLCLVPAEIRKQPEQVDLAHLSEESVQRHGFFREIRFQFLQIDVEVRRNGKARTIGKMEVVNRIHLDPTIRDAEIQK